MLAHLGWVIITYNTWHAVKRPTSSTKTGLSEFQAGEHDITQPCWSRKRSKRCVARKMNARPDGWVITTYNTWHVVMRPASSSQTGLNEFKADNEAGIHAKCLRVGIRCVLLGVAHSLMRSTSVSGAVRESCARGQAAGFPVKYNSAAQREHGGHSTTSPPGLRSQMFSGRGPMAPVGRIKERKKPVCYTPGPQLVGPLLLWSSNRLRSTRTAPGMLHRAPACGKP